MSKTKIKLSNGDISPQKNGRITAQSASPTDGSAISRYGVGFDVHKNKIAACVAAQLTTGDIIPVKEHCFLFFLRLQLYIASKRSRLLAFNIAYGRRYRNSRYGA